MVACFHYMVGWGLVCGERVGGQATVALFQVRVSVPLPVSVRSCRGPCGVVRWIRRRLVVIWRRFPNRRRVW